MNFDMPKAVFCGLALIAAAIYFGPGSAPATAAKVMVTPTGEWDGNTCRDINKISQITTNNSMHYLRNRESYEDKKTRLIMRDNARDNLSMAVQWATMYSAYCKD